MSTPNAVSIAAMVQYFNDWAATSTTESAASSNKTTLTSPSAKQPQDQKKKPLISERLYKIEYFMKQYQRQPQLNDIKLTETTQRDLAPVLCKVIHHLQQIHREHTVSLSTKYSAKTKKADQAHQNLYYKVLALTLQVIYSTHDDFVNVQQNKAIAYWTLQDQFFDIVASTSADRLCCQPFLAMLQECFLSYSILMKSWLGRLISPSGLMMMGHDTLPFVQFMMEIIKVYQNKDCEIVSIACQLLEIVMTPVASNSPSTSTYGTKKSTMNAIDLIIENEKEKEKERLKDKDNEEADEKEESSKSKTPTKPTNKQRNPIVKTIEDMIHMAFTLLQHESYRDDSMMISILCNIMKQIPNTISLVEFKERDKVVEEIITDYEIEVPSQACEWLVLTLKEQMKKKRQDGSKEEIDESESEEEKEQAEEEENTIKELCEAIAHLSDCVDFTQSQDAVIDCVTTLLHVILEDEITQQPICLAAMKALAHLSTVEPEDVFGIFSSSSSLKDDEGSEIHPCDLLIQYLLCFLKDPIAVTYGCNLLANMLQMPTPSSTSTPASSATSSKDRNNDDEISVSLAERFLRAPHFHKTLFFAFMIHVKEETAAAGASASSMESQKVASASAVMEVLRVFCCLCNHESVSKSSNTANKSTDPAIIDEKDVKKAFVTLDISEDSNSFASSSSTSRFCGLVIDALLFAYNHNHHTIGLLALTLMAQLIDHSTVKKGYYFMTKASYHALFTLLERYIGDETYSVAKKKDCIQRVVTTTPTLGDATPIQVSNLVMRIMFILSRLCEQQQHLPLPLPLSLQAVEAVHVLERCCTLSAYLSTFPQLHSSSSSTSSSSTQSFKQLLRLKRTLEYYNDQDINGQEEARSITKYVLSIFKDMLITSSYSFNHTEQITKLLFDGSSCDCIPLLLAVLNHLIQQLEGYQQTRTTSSSTRSNSSANHKSQQSLLKLVRLIVSILYPYACDSISYRRRFLQSYKDSTENIISPLVVLGRVARYCAKEASTEGSTSSSKDDLMHSVFVSILRINRELLLTKEGDDINNIVSTDDKEYAKKFMKGNPNYWSLLLDLLQMWSYRDVLNSSSSSSSSGSVSAGRRRELLEEVIENMAALSTTSCMTLSMSNDSIIPSKESLSILLDVLLVFPINAKVVLVMDEKGTTKIETSVASKVQSNIHRIITKLCTTQTTTSSVSTSTVGSSSGSSAASTTSAVTSLVDEMDLVDALVLQERRKDAKKKIISTPATTTVATTTTTTTTTTTAATSSGNSATAVVKQRRESRKSLLVDRPVISREFLLLLGDKLKVLEEEGEEDENDRDCYAIYIYEILRLINMVITCNTTTTMTPGTSTNTLVGGLGSPSKMNNPPMRNRLVYVDHAFEFLTITSEVPGLLEVIQQIGFDGKYYFAFGGQVTNEACEVIASLLKNAVDNYHSNELLEQRDIATGKGEKNKNKKMQYYCPELFEAVERVKKHCAEWNEQLEASGCNQLLDRWKERASLTKKIQGMITNRRVVSPPQQPEESDSAEESSNEEVLVDTLLSTTNQQRVEVSSDSGADKSDREDKDAIIDSGSDNVEADMMDITEEPMSQEVMDTEDNVLRAFLCPLTKKVMQDPVLLSDGNSYERQAIEQWLQTSDRSPCTNEVLVDKKIIIPNNALKNAIKEYISEKQHTGKKRVGEQTFDSESSKPNRKKIRWSETISK